MLLAATHEGIIRIDATAELVHRGDVRCLASTEGVLYAGTDDGVHRSDDGGHTWRRAGLTGVQVRSLAPGDGALYAGVRPARVHVSHDRGETWAPLAPFPRRRSWFWFTPAERPFRQPYVLGLAVTRDTLVAGIEFGAVLVSENGGGAWSGHRRGAFRDCHQLLAAGGRIYEAGYGGCAVSGDGGRRWSRPRDGLPHRYGYSVAVMGDVRYLAASRGPASDGLVYRAEGDGPWSRALGPLASLPALAASGEIHAARAGELWTSSDGREWHRRDLPLGRVRALLSI